MNIFTEYVKVGKYLAQDLLGLITARIRRMGEGNIFTLCVSPHLDWGRGGGLPHTRSGWGGGGTPSQVCTGGGGYPIPCLMGGPPWQDWMGYPLSQDWMGYLLPRPEVDGVNPPPHSGLDGVHPPPIRQSSIASTCYAAGSMMPLAFTQEDFHILLHIFV